MSHDLLATLEASAPATPPSKHPASLPLRVLADWFFADCTAKSLQPRTISFYRLKLSYLRQGETWIDIDRDERFLPAKILRQTGVSITGAYRSFVPAAAIAILQGTAPVVVFE